MDEPIYDVYIRIDENNCIVAVESTAFHTSDELTEKGYVKIDEGGDGYVYGHAQPNYLYEKYGKPTYDENGYPNFKYDGGNIVELTEEEKKPDATPAEPTFEEMQNDINLDFEFRISMLELGM